MRFETRFVVELEVILKAMLKVVFGGAASEGIVSPRRESAYRELTTITIPGDDKHIFPSSQIVMSNNYILKSLLFSI